MCGNNAANTKKFKELNSLKIKQIAINKQKSLMRFTNIAFKADFNAKTLEFQKLISK